jgi:hypothetical protein
MLIDWLTRPPKTCEAFIGLPYKDCRKKGGIWHCKLAKKNIGKGGERPACLCRAALTKET